MRKRKQGNCFGTARLDVIKKSIESKAPHCHEPNDKSSKIHNFYKIVRIECEKLPTQLHKYKFEEMAEDFCAKEGIERKENIRSLLITNNDSFKENKTLSLRFVTSFFK